MAFMFPSDKNIEKRLLAARLEDTLEMLKDVRERLVEIQTRIDTIERVLAERLPPDVLTEKSFKQEVQTSDEIIDKIMAKVEELNAAKSIRQILEERLEEKPTPVEMKRIEMITKLLNQHGRLSSEDLSKHMGLSRTRCNEYFKQMEEMGIVESAIVGKEKYYSLG